MDLNGKSAAHREGTLRTSTDRHKLSVSRTVVGITTNGKCKDALFVQ